MAGEVKVEYTFEGALGPLTVDEMQVLRNAIYGKGMQDLDQAEINTVEKFGGYLNGLIEEQTSVGKIYG